MAKKSVEQLEKENNELRKKIAELEKALNEDENDDIEEIENPYTVTNRAIDELVNPKDTMYYLSGNQIPIVR